LLVTLTVILNSRQTRFRIEDFSGLWTNARDLLDPKQSTRNRERAIRFMGALAAGDNFNRLGPLRMEFMSLVLEP
jgi:hypothetical protein